MPSEFFPDPSPAVYWFWHSVPTPEEIIHQVADMHAAGINTFLIQARTAFPLEEYLGEEYFHAYRLAMQEAKKRQMTVGIYDDYNWNSGHAGGRSVRANDNARERQLFWTTGKLSSRTSTLEISEIQSLLYSGMGDGILNWIYEGGVPVWDDWQIFKALALPPDTHTWNDEDIIDISEYARISENRGNGCRIEIQTPEGLEGYEKVVFVHGKCATSRMINYLSPEAVETYIDAGYAPYKEAAGKFFEAPIRYIFFDHPYTGFYNWKEHTGQIGNSLMFVESLPQTFFDQKHYPLEKSLLHFLLPHQPNTANYRSDFFEVYGELGRETFFGRLKTWAEENHLALTGHELLGHVGAWGYTEGFGNLDPRTNFAGDYFAIDRYRHYTAVDASNYAPQISAKIGDSVAKAHGRRGCIIEQYSGAETPGVPFGAGIWGLTYNQLRAQAIRHQLFGASQFLFHGYYQTDGSAEDHQLYANARFDFAPGINYEPWFNHFSNLSKELSNLSELIQHSSDAPQVAVYFPLETWWTEDIGHLFSSESALWFQFLFENQIGFDVINWQQLESAVVEGTKLKIGEQSYSGLIFPGVTTLKSEKCAQVTAEYMEKGGLFIATGALPKFVLGETAIPQTHKLFSELVTAQSHSLFLDEFNPILIQRLLDAQLEATSIKVTESSAKNIWTWQGKRNEDHVSIYFHDHDQADQLLIQFGQKQFRPYILNLENGDEQPWLWYQIGENEITALIDAQPYELGAVVFKKTEAQFPYVSASSPLLNRKTVIEPQQVSISGEISSPGKHEIILNTSIKPMIFVDPGINPQINKVGDSQWWVTFSVETIPPTIELPDWHLSLPGKLENHIVDIRQGWERQGGNDFAGEGLYTCTFDFDDSGQDYAWRLVLPRVETTVEGHLNGKKLAWQGHSPYEWLLPSATLKKANNILQLQVRNSAANYYYAGTPFQPEGQEPSGIIGLPKLVCSIPFTITINHEKEPE